MEPWLGKELLGWGKVECSDEARSKFVPSSGALPSGKGCWDIHATAPEKRLQIPRLSMAGEVEAGAGANSRLVARLMHEYLSRDIPVILTDTAFSSEELALLATEAPLATPVSKQRRRRHATGGNAANAAQARGGEEEAAQEEKVYSRVRRGGFPFPLRSAGLEWVAETCWGQETGMHIPHTDPDGLALEGRGEEECWK